MRVDLVGGRRAAPPDDCGGLPGYDRLLEVLNDPSDPEQESLIEWFTEYGGRGPSASFDPAAFDSDNADGAVRLALS